MKSIILYAYTGEVPGVPTDYDQVSLPNDNDVCYVFVRAEVVDEGVGAALDMAQPREGETVLNTIPYRE